VFVVVVELYAVLELVEFADDEEVDVEFEEPTEGVLVLRGSKEKATIAPAMIRAAAAPTANATRLMALRSPRTNFEQNWKSCGYH
jgi:hypothetical protein